jgi:hypothetical protein
MAWIAIPSDRRSRRISAQSSTHSTSRCLDVVPIQPEPSSQVFRRTRQQPAPCSKSATAAPFPPQAIWPPTPASRRSPTAPAPASQRTPTQEQQQAAQTCLLPRRLQAGKVRPHSRIRALVHADGQGGAPDLAARRPTQRDVYFVAKPSPRARQPERSTLAGRQHTATPDRGELPTAPISAASSPFVASGSRLLVSDQVTADGGATRCLGRF